MTTIRAQLALRAATLAVALAGGALAASGLAAETPSAATETLARVLPRIVKIHGAGGFRGLEAYQSGMLISADGAILTVWSHVLDTDYLSVTLDDGRRFDARLLGAHPRLEVAVLKIDAEGLPHFDLNDGIEAAPGTRVLALSNLFGVATGNEPVSVQRGVVSVRTSLAARRGVFETPYDGPIHVLDAVTNNPGAAGGAVVTRRGDLVGMIGKELRNANNHTWLNYAVPAEELREPVEAILAGRFAASPEPDREKPVEPATLDGLGLVLVPEVLDRTPPYVDAVRPDSPAARAGLRPDDLVVMVGDRLVSSCQALRDELAHLRREDPVRLSVMRGQEWIEVELKPSP
ncbi:MAG: serine protease [Pirellulales bacterium]|nr:serine protease [Pirellulales bacterium]